MATTEKNTRTAAYYSLYEPEEFSYTPRDAQTLRGQIADWLRPAYELAIGQRREQTDQNEAEIDADAIARGMGASSYVSDVKARQKDSESSDVTKLETEYAASLAKYLYEALDAENARKFEADSQNAARRAEAYLLAYEQSISDLAAANAAAAAQSGSGRKSTAVSEEEAIIATTPEICERFLQNRTMAERAAIYAGTDALSLQYQKELIASVGADGYARLKKRYPTSVPQPSAGGGLLRVLS